MVCASKRIRQDRRLAELHRTLSVCREAQLLAASQTNQSAASNGAFCLGAAKGLQFAMAAVELAIREESAAETPVAPLYAIRDELDARENALDGAPRRRKRRRDLLGALLILSLPVAATVALAWLLRIGV